MKANQSDEPMRQETAIRQELLKALTYPRSYVLKKIDLRECPYDGLFESSSDRCQDCDLRKDCLWLSCLRKLSGSPTKPTYTIHASLMYGLSLIEANNKRVQHDSDTCTCESCTWTRDTRQLPQKFQTLSLGDLYRSVY